ncbi:MAG: citrate lyase subunit beta / citryl-CoA lyase [bacterium]
MGSPSSDDTAAALPPRCCLSVPASSERMLAKARGIEVDELVLDLEDAVAPDQKAAARAAVVEALADGGFAAPRVAVRVNAPGTPWCHEDVLALASAPVPPVSLVIPKVEREAELQFVELLLAAVRARTGREPALRLQALIETARGVAAVDRVAESLPRLEALIVGYADLAASLGRRDGLPSSAWLAVQDRVLVAARANGLAAIDGPCLTIEPQDALRAEVQATRALGYDGKWAIHPAQIDVITGAFTPTEDERAQARATLEALAAAEAGGAGAAAVSGAMVDEASRRRAVAVLARADRG